MTAWSNGVTVAHFAAVIYRMHGIQISGVCGPSATACSEFAKSLEGHWVVVINCSNFAPDQEPQTLQRTHAINHISQGAYFGQL